MTHSLKLFICIALSTIAAFAQNEPSTSGPVAFAYITTGPSEIIETVKDVKNTVPDPAIEVYSVASNGRLSFLQGVASKYNFTGGAANNKYFFALSLNYGDTPPFPAVISSYAIQGNGTLKYVASTNMIKSPDWCYYQNENSDPFNLGVTPLQVDSAGQTLYIPVTKCVGSGTTKCDEGGACAQAFESFHISSNGGLSYLGVSSFDGYGGPIVTLGNDKYGYVVGGLQAPYFVGYGRESNGLATKNGSTLEPLRSGVTPSVVANDSTDHLAIAWSNGVIGSYTASANGNLTTTNKSTQMPCCGDDFMSISPNNEFLAVAGGGLEFFKFNGAEPITYLAGPFYGSGGASINGIAWDNNNHLLAVSAFGDMYVETVTETGATPAPGSPYPNDGAAGYYGGYSISVVPVAK